MMATKPKPDTSTCSENDSNDLEKDLERRLALLGDVAIDEVVEEKQPAAETETPPPVQDKPPIMNPRPIMLQEVAETAPAKEQPALMKEQQPIAEPEISAPPLPVQDVKPPVMNPRNIMLENKVEPTSKVEPGGAKGNKNALLARIMAVQEKAKQAQLKKESEVMAYTPASQISVKEQMMRKLEDSNEMNGASTFNNSNTTVMQLPQTNEEPAIVEQAPSVADYRNKMMEALNEDTEKKKQNVPPPPPPPSFDILEMHQPQEIKLPEATSPPSFDAIEYNMMDEPVMPSAPPVESLAPPPPPDILSGNHLSGITSIVPPPPATDEQKPPSFESLQQDQQNNTEVEEMCDFDLDGNKLTPEEKQKMMEEQRAILAQIKKDAVQNSVSEAAARAVAFDQRSNTAAAAAAAAAERPSTTPITCEVASSTDGVEHNIKQKSVDIGGGQKVALHGQEKTRAAIKNGTAVLVKCLNCDNWMQVTQAATLMFCPICSVVSPVVKQDNAPTTEEARQMDEDRKLAEKLQKEEDAKQRPGRQSEGYPAQRRGAAASSEDEGGSWLGGLLPSSMWSTTEEPTSGSSEINVSRPPGASGLINANIGTRANEGNDLRLEEESLLGGDQYRRRPARVAEQKPMFSCFVDSISSTADAMSGAVYGYSNPSDGETVHGVDSTSFLSMGNPDRGDHDGSGSYRPV